MNTQNKYRMEECNNHNGLLQTDGCKNRGGVHSSSLQISNACANLFNSSLFTKSFLRTLLMVAFFIAPGVASAAVNFNLVLSSTDMCGSDYHASFENLEDQPITLNVTLNSIRVVDGSIEVIDNTDNTAGNKLHYDIYNFNPYYFGSYHYKKGTYHLYYNSTNKKVVIEKSANAYNCGLGLTSSLNSLSLSATAPNASSSSSFTVTGSSLEGDVTISLGASSKLELCDTENGTYSSIVVISQSDATSGKIIYVRIKSNQSTAANESETITISTQNGSGTVSKTVAANVTVTESSVSRPTATISNCANNNNPNIQYGNFSDANFAGNFNLSTTDVSDQNKVTICAPDGFLIKKNDGSNSPNGAVSSIELDSNDGNQNYWVYLSPTASVGSHSGYVTVKYNNAVIDTADCQNQGTITSSGGSSPSVTINSCDPISNLTVGGDKKVGTINITVSNLQNQTLTVGVENGFTISKDDKKDNASFNLSSDVTDKTYYIYGSNAGSSTVHFQISNTEITPSGTNCTFSIGTTANTPTIALSGCSPTSLTGVSGSLGSNYKSFSVSGSNLNADITVSAPTGFVVSTDQNSGFTNSLTLFRSSNNAVNNTTIYVRMSSSAAVNSYSGNVTVSSSNATSQNCEVSGSVSSSGEASVWNCLINDNLGGSAQKSLPLNWDSTNTDGVKSWCTISNNYYPYIVHNPIGYVQSPAISMKKGNRYKIRVTSCGDGFPAVKLFSTQEQEYALGNFSVSGTKGEYEFVFGNEDGTYNLRLGYGYNKYIDSVYVCEQQTSISTLTVTCPSSSFEASAGSTGTEQMITVSGTDLTNTISVSVGENSDFEIAKQSDQDYSSSLSGISPSETTTIKVRLKNTSTAGTKSGTLTVSSDGAESITCTLEGTVTCPSITLDGVTVKDNLDDVSSGLENGSTYTGWIKGTVPSNVGVDEHGNTHSKFALNFNCISSSLTSANYEGASEASDNGDYLYFDRNNVPVTTAVDSVKLAGHPGLTYKIGFTQSGNALNYTLEPLITVTTPASMLAMKGTAGDPVPLHITATGLEAPVSFEVPSGFDVKVGDEWKTAGDAVTIALPVNSSNASLNYIDATLYVRLAANPASGDKNETLYFSSTRADQLSVSLSGVVMDETCPDEMNFTTTAGTPSVAKEVTFSITNQESPITVTAPFGFEISKTETGSYSGSLSFSTSDAKSYFIRISDHAVGSFTASVTYSYGMVSASSSCLFSANVDPSFSFSTLNAETCGSDVMLSAVAIGFPEDVTFAWYDSNDHQIGNSVTQPQDYTTTSVAAVIYNVSWEDAGVYTLKASNGSSLTTTLTVPRCKASVAPLYIIPTSSSVKVGDPVTLILSSPSSADLNGATIVWQKSGDGNVWETIPQASGTSYTVVGGYSYDGVNPTGSTFGSYRAQISGDDYELVTSEVATVSRTPNNVGTSCDASSDVLRFDAYDILVNTHADAYTSEQHTEADELSDHLVTTGDDGVYMTTEPSSIYYLGEVNFYDGCCYDSIRVKFASLQSDNELSFFWRDENNVNHEISDVSISAGSGISHSLVTFHISCYVKEVKKLYMQVKSGTPNVCYVELFKKLHTGEDCSSVVISKIDNALCVGGLLRISPTVNTSNLKGNVVTYRWYKGDVLLDNSDKDYVKSNATNEDVGTYTLKAYLCDELMATESVTVSAYSDETSLPEFSYVEGNGSSTTQSFTVRVPSCVETQYTSVSVTGSGFSISTSASSGFGSSLSHIANGTTIYVRLNKDLPVSSYSGSVSLEADGVTFQTVNLSGSVVSACVSGVFYTQNFGTTASVDYPSEITINGTYFAQQLNSTEVWTRTVSIVTATGVHNALNHNSTGGVLFFDEGDQSSNNINENLFLFKKADAEIDENLYYKLDFDLYDVSQYALSFTLSSDATGTNKAFYSVSRSGNSETVISAKYSEYVSGEKLKSGVQFKFEKTSGRSAFAIDNISITRVCPPTVSISLTGEPCLQNAGSSSLKASVSGGVPPYTYQWKKSGVPLSVTTQQLALVGNGVGGLYSVTVTDAISQSQTVDYNLTCLIVNASPSKYCVGDVVTLTGLDALSQQTGYTVTGYELVNSKGVTVQSWPAGTTSFTLTMGENLSGTYKMKVAYKKKDNETISSVIYSSEFALKEKSLCGVSMIVTPPTASYYGDPVLLSASLTGGNEDYNDLSLSYKWQVKSEESAAWRDTNVVSNSLMAKPGIYRVYAYVAEDDVVSWSESVVVTSYPIGGDDAIVLRTESGKNVCCDENLVVKGVISYNTDYQNLCYKWMRFNGDQLISASDCKSMTGKTSPFIVDDYSLMVTSGSENLILAVFDASTSSSLSQSEPFVVQRGLLCGETLSFDLNRDTLCDDEVMSPRTLTMPHDMSQNITYRYVIHRGFRNGTDIRHDDPVHMDTVVVTSASNSFVVNMPSAFYDKKRSFYYVELIARDTIVDSENPPVGVDDFTYYEDKIYSDTLWVVRQLGITPDSDLMTITPCFGDDVSLSASFSYNPSYLLGAEQFSYKVMAGNVKKNGQAVVVASGTYKLGSDVLQSNKFTISDVANVFPQSDTIYSLVVSGGCSPNTVIFDINPKDCGLFSVPDTVLYCNREASIQSLYTGNLTNEERSQLMNFTWTMNDDSKTGDAVSYVGLSGTVHVLFSVTSKKNDKDTLYKKMVVVAPSSTCETNYFVNNTNGNDSHTGLSWDAAFKTLQFALQKAYAEHTSNNADLDQPINIYVTKESYQITNQGTTCYDTLQYVSIYGGFPINNTGNVIDNADGMTTITRSADSYPCFYVSLGKNEISRLKFENMNTSRVIQSAGTNKEENLTIDNCEFISNTAGAILLNSTNGGELNVYDCKFTGNKLSKKGKDEGYGGAIYMDGPYDLLISSLKDTSLWPGTSLDLTELSKGCNGETNTYKTLELLDINDTTKVSNVFSSNVEKSYDPVIRGGAVYIHQPRSVRIENAIFKDNKNERTAASYGCALYIDNNLSSSNNTSPVVISKTYFLRNYDNFGYGCALYLDSVQAKVDYSLFKENKFNDGYGGAFAGLNSRMDILNSCFDSNEIKGNNGSGGGFYAANSTLITISNSKFKKNRMPSGLASGGGAYVQGAFVNMNNTVFEKNYAQENGGAFYAGGNLGADIYDPSTNITVRQSVFKENFIGSGNGLAGAICAKNMDIEIFNSYFYRNNARESSGPVTVKNGKLKLFASTFYSNRATTQNAVAGAVIVDGHPDGASATVPNAYIYNSTFTGNGGAERGIVCLSGTAYGDIVSCTIVDNDGTVASVNSSGEMIDGSTNAKLAGGVCLFGAASRVNILNTILSGNMNNAENRIVNLKINGSENESALTKTSQLLNFKYNTLGSSIYFLNNGTEKLTASSSYSSASCDRQSILSSSTCTISEFTCENISFSTDNLYEICNYGAPVALTRPFKGSLENSDLIYCRDYGMSVQELQDYQKDYPELAAELVQDEHRSIRGWRRLCLDCDATSEDIKETFRTYQGAVEGGIGVYDGKKFDLEVSRMVGLCSGGELSPAYINIRILKSNGDNKTILADSLIKYYGIDIYREFQNNGIKTNELFYSKKRLEYNVINGDTCVRLTSVPSGLYSVIVSRYDSISKDGEKVESLQEKHTGVVEVENITETALTWIGDVSSDFNNADNWKYRDDAGNVITSKTVAAPPSPCFDIHIGLESPTDAGETVAHLPTIKEADVAGECADVYFHLGGSLGQIQKLAYKKAHVEVSMEAYARSTVPDTKWYMISAPLKGMVSGDYLAENRSVYIRYFNIQKSGDTYAGAWTYSVANVGESLSNLGMGYAYRYFTMRPSYYLTDKVTYTFPSESLSYSYYDGTKEGVRTSVSFRFLPEDEKTNKIAEETKVKINLIDRNFPMADNQMGADKEDEAKGYVIVGNPFMAHIDLNAFYLANKEVITPDIKLYTKCNFETYKLTETDGTVSGTSTGGGGSSNYNRYIPPMQAFFVKPKNIAADGTVTLNFPASSVTCAVISSGSTLRGAMVAANRLGIRAKYGTWTSPMAYVMAQGKASNGFLGSEDSQKLLYSGAIVDVYTNAGNVPADINILDADSLAGLTIPVTVSVYKAGAVSIVVSGMEGFDEAADVYWNDRQTGTKVSLKKQATFDYSLAKGTTAGRFFLSFAQKRRVKVMESDTICLGDVYNYKLGVLKPTTAGDFVHRKLEKIANPAVADTIYYVDLKVNSSYLVHWTDSIMLGEAYDDHGFLLPAQRSLGTVRDTLHLTTVNGCDSTVCLELKVKGVVYEADVYYGNDKPIRVQVDSLGNGLDLTGNALAYFENRVPASLCGRVNVVCRVGDVYLAKKVALSDSADLYIPYGFMADSIVYTRKPSIYADRSRGWETIVLPFTATEFRNSGCVGDTGLAARSLVPFNKSDDVTYGDFWLKRFVSSRSDAIGFEYPDAPVLMANEPYIVAYPGRAWGVAYSLLGQTICYTATAASVSATPDPIRVSTDHFYIYGTTGHATVNRAYLLRPTENRFDLTEAVEVVPPFRAFVMARQYSPSPLRSLGIYDETDGDDDYTTLGSFEAEGPDIFVVYEKNGNLCIYSSKMGEADIYDVTARKVIRSKVRYVKGETIVSGLPKGIYLVNGAKVIL